MSSMGSTVSVKGMMGDIAILETDKDLLVEFHKGAILNAAKSRDAGTPIYDEADFCKIIRPGEPHSVWNQPVRPIDKMRFQAQWQAYQSGQSQIQSGTPLDLLFPDTPATVANLKAIHIHTIQALAAISDNAIGNIPFGHDLREKAKRYMAAVEKKTVDHQHIERELSEAKAQLETLQSQVATLTAAAAPKPRGRPRKDQQQSA